MCYRNHPGDILVRVGTSTLKEGGSVHFVTKIIPHANYNENIYFNYDIALLKVRIIIIVLLDWFYRKYIYIYIYMCVCVCVYIYIYIYEELTKMFDNRLPHSCDGTL